MTESVAPIVRTHHFLNVFVPEGCVEKSIVNKVAEFAKS